MKKLTMTLAAAVLILSAKSVMAQDKTEATTPATVQTAENKQKEADALQTRIEQYTIKVEANKGNASLDYEAEMTRISEMKKKWEGMTGKTWKEEEKK
ncbi:MAG: hypothetical protein QF371_03600 [Flavobacteriales bacterium]|nr:hypothetical protein [Flavobacteriales bacterium]